MAVVPYAPFVDTALFIGPTRIPSVLSFSTDRNTEQTDVPIELGADIAIHRRRAPMTISLSAVVSEFEPFDGAPALFSKINDVRNALELADKLGTLLLVRWMGQLWPNMTIRSLKGNHEGTEREDVWRFDMMLKETQLASSLTVPSADSLGSLTASTLEGGPQAGAAVGPEGAAQVSGIVGGGV
jgi:hypothetical protein